MKDCINKRMIDFTIHAYKKYLEAIKLNYANVLRFDDFFKLKQNLSSYCLIRHDVDRNPLNALKMATIENESNIRSTYYFRFKKNTFKPELIKQISNLGHEVGYHYENLSDFNGDYVKALENFKLNLFEFRKITPVNTISMHGKALSKHDNRDLWNTDPNKLILKNELDILGEVYLDIDYSDMLYITDTGRNWTHDVSNVRDKVTSNIRKSFENGKQLLGYLQNKPHSKLCFQIHPERWNGTALSFAYSYTLDNTVNIAKKVIKSIK